jgi:prefoldin subunit 5
MTKREHELDKLNERIHEIDIEVAAISEKMNDLLEERRKIVEAKTRLPDRNFLKEIQAQRRGEK